MKTELFWVPTPFPGRLAVAPRLRGGDWLDDEMKTWRGAGIDAVVSLLAPDEVAEFELGREAEAAAAQGMHYLALPVVDRGVPASRSAFRELVDAITRELVAGHRAVVHCRQGIGRAGLVAAGVLIAAGIDPEAAVARLAAARGRTVPETPEQRRWLDEFANETETLTVGNPGGAPEGHKG